MIIGISGYTGSGKSILAEYLSKKLNAQIIDADKIARKIMLEDFGLIAEINEKFEMRNEKFIDFAKLGKIVFESGENLKKLNQTTFPYIIPAIKSKIGQANPAPTLLDAPLLPLISPQEICDFAIWVNSPIETRIERLTKRHKLNREVVKNRIEKQMEMMPAPKADDFWHFVENNSQQNTFFEAAEKIILPFYA